MICEELSAIISVVPIQFETVLAFLDAMLLAVVNANMSRWFHCSGNKIPPEFGATICSMYSILIDDATRLCCLAHDNPMIKRKFIEL